MFENLELIRKIEEQRLRFQEIKRETFAPLLRDPKYISQIYGYSGMLKGVTKTERRQAFILTTLLFYSPEKVIGGKINKSVMRTLCEVTGCGVSLISHNAQNLLFFCNHYTNFRDAVQMLIDETCVMLLAEGMDRDEVFAYLDKFNGNKEKEEE